MAQPITKFEASAGSGKTYRLALEYLGRLLLAFADFRGKAMDRRQQRERLGSILAITFTVKAAQEMKERILEKLKRFALSQGEAALHRADEEFLAHLARETGLAPGRIIELAGRLIELILAGYDDFNVTTIDSLMSAMVKAVSPDLDLPADYEIAVDAGAEMEACGRAMLSRLADSDWGRLRRLLEDIRRLNHGVTWKIDDSIVEKVVALFRRTLRQESEDAAPADLRQRLATTWNDFRERLRQLLPLLLKSESGGKQRPYFSKIYLRQAMLDHIAATLDKDDSSGMEEFIRSTFFRKDDPEELLIKDAPDDYRERFSAAYRPAQEALRQAVLAFSAFKALPYRELLGDFGVEWKEGKKILFVEEFSHALAGLFDQWRQEAFPYLYLKLSDRFNSFLFDEFQDTSTLQFRALAPLIDEVLSREKSGSLFVVGDRKQAIYRWRGGNSELMDEGRLREEIPAIDHLSAKEFSSTLSTNWRSRRRIVDFNNEFWSPDAISRIAAADDLQQAIRTNFRDSRQEVPKDGEDEGGYVEISLRVEAEENSEKEGGETAREDDGGALSAAHLDMIDGIVDRLHDEHGYDYSDIAVLVRKNDQVRSVIRRLGRRKIGSVSDQSLLLCANVRIAEIIAFLRFLDYPPDNLGFFSFVNGGIFRAAAENRLPKEMGAFSEEAFIDCRGAFYKLFREKFPHLWQELIEPFFQAVGFLPPYDLFSDITQAFRVYENFPGDTPFFLALGDALHRAERQGGSSIAGFLRQWQKLIDAKATPSVFIPQGTPGVRVLTMHQSKGLEFPAVIVPLDDSGGRSDDNLHSDREGLFYINSDIAQAHPGQRQRYEGENIRGSLDLLNLLYVAFTRAEEALFVPVAVKNGIGAPENARNYLIRKISRASDVIGRHPLLKWFEQHPKTPYENGALARKEKKLPAMKEPVSVSSKRIPTRSWQSRYLVFDRAKARKRGDRPASERGERIHDLLARVGAAAGPQELAARVRELAAQAGWPERDTEAVAGFLLRDDVSALLGRGGDIHLEKEIVNNSGAAPELRRLDRLQVGAEEVLVIDFKTGKEKSDEYQSQMEEYLRIVGPLHPDRKCRGFILYIDRNEIEEVSCSN